MYRFVFLIIFACLPLATAHAIPTMQGFSLGGTKIEKVHILSVTCRSGVNVQPSTVDVLVLFRDDSRSPALSSIINRYFIEFKACLDFQSKQVDSDGRLVTGQIGDLHFDTFGNIYQIDNLQSRAFYPDVP
jgi:hypothetical protein